MSNDAGRDGIGWAIQNRDLTTRARLSQHDVGFFPVRKGVPFWEFILRVAEVTVVSIAMTRGRSIEDIVRGVGWRFAFQSARAARLPVFFEPDSRHPDGLGLSRMLVFLIRSRSVTATRALSTVSFAFHTTCFMLGEYKVGRCTRQCHAQQRPLREGEWYYSVVIESGDDYIRRDYSAESWTGPPADAVGWWKSRMPKADEKKLVLAPPEVLVDLLRQMEEVPAKAKSRYLLALMLMRRRMLRPATPSSSTREGIDVLRVEVVATGDLMEVPVCTISRSESDSLRDELNELLYCEAESVESGEEAEE